MTDTLSQARQLIERRLSELQAEAARLDKALRELSSDNMRPTEGSARKVRKRAPRGQRQRDFLAAVEAKPGIRASEVAQEIGVSANQAYALANKLRKQKKIRKSGKGYRVKL
jgi:transposase-like protein